MASTILRRSGNAVCEYLGYLNWKPKAVYMVGVGVHHQEVDVMRETWSDFCLYGFEPNPDIYKQAFETFPGVIRDYAVSNYTGRGNLYCKPKWKDGSSLIPHLGEPEKYHQVPVEVTTLDKLKCIMPADSPGLLWLDCEGSEFDVLEGGKDFIRERVEVINIEQTARPRLGDNWPSPYKVHQLLTYYGFLQAWTHTHRTVIGQFDSIYLKKNIFNPAHCSCLESIRYYNDFGEKTCRPTKV